MTKEGFTDSFQLQNYFFRRVQTIVDKYHKKTNGWNEILKGGEINPNTLISAWQGINYGIESAKEVMKPL
ncbi:family 20 glycosylhydrolase [Flavobacterium sp. 140616W15]|uniref:family 20 glycosylhydrolase n=1 Tax=Flavobacterium sp. 140616W15 TaxID=2478552 RepID=UPI002110716B|nr:family 20 glycosylhydrolase [Flavobacterium sp. 140616W15]